MADNVQRNLVRDWFRATERCNINQLNRLKDQVNIEVSTTWSMNNEDHRNVTALTLSAYIGRKEVVKWFIELGCRVNVATHLGWTPLHFAASQGFVSTVDMLCQAGAKIDVKTNRGETAIQLALRGNMRDTVRKLLNRGASIDNLEHTKMGGRGGRGREMHSLNRSRGGGTHPRVGGLGLSSPGRGSGHHPLNVHSHPGHHHSHHHGGHYSGQGSGRELGIGGAGGGGNAGSSIGGAVMSNSVGGVVESAEVARKRRELFRQIGDESRLGKAVRQLIRDPATRHNAASVKQALIDHLMEPMNQIQARQWKRQSEMLVDSLETLICEHQTPDNRANRRLLCDCIFLIVDQWSETMYKDYLLRLVDSATQGRSAVLRCAMLELLKQFLDREFQRRQKLSELAAQHHESSATAFNSGMGSGEEASENTEGMDNGRDNQQSPDRGVAISIVSFDLVDQVLRLLNSDDSAPVIAASCRVLLAYARLFRVSFLEEEHFFTLVDHVVGWCVDPKTADTDADMLCRCVAECRPLWRARPQFAKEMTTNLLEDVESNVPSIPSVADTAPCAMTGGGKVRIAIEKERASLEESLIRISRFLRVACAICRSLNLQAEDCPSSVHRQFDYEALFKMCGQIVNLVSPILRNLSHFLKSTMSSCPSPQAALTVVLLSNSPALFAGANWLLSDLVVNLITSHSHADKCQSLYNSIVIFLANQMIFAAQANIIQHHTDYQLSVISLTEVLVDKTRMGLNFDWVVLYRLLGPLSPIHNYKLTTNNRVQRRLLALFTRFAHLESLQLVDVFYQILLSDFEVCLQTLIQACNSNSKVALVRENGFQERRYSPEEALALAIFNLGVISEIGVSQLAGLWSLTPTLFDLFVKYAPVRDQHLMQTYPHLHVAMFTALLAHCREQKWLVECSRLAGQSVDSAAEFPRRDGYLEELLALLTDMLESKGCTPPFALCDLLLDAVEGIIGRVADKMLWSVLESSPMLDTISALLTFISVKTRLGGGSNVWSLGAACLRHVFRACRLVERFLSLCSPSRVSDSSIPRLASDLTHAVLPLGGGVTQSLLGILARLPSSGGVVKSGKGLVSRQWRAGRHLTSGALALRLPVWTGDRFRVEHCQTLLTAFLCQHPPPNAAPDWPQRLFSSLCLAEGGLATGEGHERLLVAPALRWAALAWETVRFVLERKLKVAPWGKPTDAFLEVEQLLHRLAGRKSSVPHWAVSFILLFVEWLERGLYQAYEGAATIPLQPPLSPPIRHFFRTNRRTCLTWVTRNRPGIMRVAAGAGLYPLVVRHGLAWLQAEGTVKEETEDVLRMTAKALRQLGQGEMLKGLSSIPCAARMDLLLAGMSEAAAGRMEKAQSLLEAQLEEKRDEEVAADSVRRAGSGDVVLLTKPVSTPPSSSARPDAVARCVFDELIHCYSQLHDLRGLRAFRERLQRWTSSGPYSGPASEALHSRADQWRYWTCVGRLQNWEEEKKPSWMLDENLASQERKLYSALASGLPSRVERASAAALVECSALAGGLGLHWPSSLPASLRSSVRSAQLCRDSNPGHFTLSLPHLHLRRLASHFIPDLGSDEATIPVVRWCRRFNNVQAATRLLIGENAKLEGLSDLLTPDSNVGLELQQEVSKVLCEAGKKKEAWLGLCQAMTGALKRQGEVEEEEAVRLQAKAALSLARWLRRDGEDMLDDSADSALNFISELSQRKWVDGCVPTIAAEEEGEADRCVENVIGRLSVLASKLSPMMAKAWFAVGDWSFERSRADLKALARRQFHVNLTDSERQQLEQLLPRGHTEEELEQAACILASLPSTTTSGPTGEQELRQRLQDEVFCLQVAPPDQLEAIMLIWRGVLDRVYGLSVSAANGYFTFLRLSAGESEGEENDKERRMTAALRLLKLLANHIHELGHLLSEGFANTPTEPWLNIIPQVFARLNHPSPAVRDCLTGLVCRLGKDAPHRIVYPAVVGAACASSKSSPEGGEVGEGMSRESPESAPATGSTLNGEGEDEDMDEVVKEVTEMEEEKADDGQDDPLLLNTFTSLMEAMTRDNPVLVREVVTFVEEMRRITVLWDELWLGTLSQHAEEMQKKMVQLQSEIKKVQEHEHLSEMTKSRLIQIIYETYMKPIVLSLEKIRFITSTSAETPHEEWFQEQFDTTISEVIARLKSPTEPSRPEAAAHALKSLHQTLHQKSQARRRLIGQGQLDLAQISPRLAAIDSSVIPMPGEVKGGVSIREIQNAFFILPTKTKPKKLIFVGDNGQRYPYLFKGLEDLHLDERIMQFLGTVNAMFTRLNRAPSPKFFARHYAVTPLGPRSALIQMVQGATPLFPLYKKWQQREAIAQAAKQQRTVPPPPPPPVLSPSELFFSKLRPALEAKGFHTGDDAKILESRKDWPISVLRSVLGELMRETPNDLLSQELWLSSVSSVDWWQSVQNFARSVAVMSSIGYVLGLGDRHLDNVMVDLSNGDIVHIDYNVCFEKGKNLKVPETVPFRLTAVLRHALGPAGVEGMFRSSCERVLKTLRERQDVLLTLLDAFVYDPLIDWTPGSESGYAGAHYGGRSDAAKGKFPTRRQLEREITQQFLGIRAVQMDPALRLWQAEFLRILENVRVPAECLAQLASDLGAETRRLQLYREMQDYLSVTDVEVKPSLRERYARYCERERSRQLVAQAVEAKGEEVGGWCQRHSDALAFLRSDFVPSLIAKLGRKPSPTTLVEYQTSAVTFLESAGQASLAEAAGTVVVKIDGLLTARTTCLTDCLNVITVYRSHTELFREEALQDRFAVLNTLLSRLEKTLKKSTCTSARETYRKRFTDDEEASPEVPVDGMEEQLRNQVSELSRRLAATLAERRQVPAASAEDNVDVIYRTLLQTVSIDGGAAYKLAIAESLQTMCRDWINLDERLVKGGGAAGDSLNLDNDESSSWFVYEESCFSLLLNQLAVFLSHVHVGSEALKVVRLLDELSSKLRKLHSNLCNILLPEAARILTGLAELDGPLSRVLELADAGADLVSQLEARMKAGGDEDTPPAAASAGPGSGEMGELSLKARRVRKEWLRLLDSMEKEQSHLLILAFHNELSQMEAVFLPLVLAFRALFMPQDWYFVDALTSAYHCLQPVWYLPHSDVLFLDLLFLKGLRLLADVIRICRRFSQAFHEPGAERQGCADSRAIVSHYLNFVWGGVLCGVGPSLCAFLLCALLEDAHLSLSMVAAEQTRLYNGMTAPAHSLLQLAVEYRAQEHANLTVTQQLPPPWHDFPYLHSHVTSLVTSMSNVAQRQHTQVVMDNCVKMVEGRLQRAQRALASFQWLHTDRLAPEADLATPSRASILNELQRNCTQLETQNETLKEAAAEMKRQHDSIAQRLRWAQGANPNVASVLEAVEEAYGKNEEVLREDGSNVELVLAAVQAVLHLENFRTRSAEAAAQDQRIDDTFEAWLAELESAEAAEASEVTDLEQELMRVAEEEERDEEEEGWTERLTAALTARCAELVARLKDRKKSAMEEIERLGQFEGELKASVGRHTRLLNSHDIRTVLKAMARFDDPRVKTYAREYRRFSTEFSAMLRMLGELEKEKSESAIVNVATQVVSHRAKLAALVQPLRHHLRKLAPNLDIEEDKQDKDTEEEREEEKKMDAKPKTGNTGGPALTQARNPFALAVWRRVQAKLTGRDGPAMRGRDPFTVEEQVDWIIKEATNLDNLALMYEGWTAWL